MTMTRVSTPDQEHSDAFKKSVADEEGPENELQADLTRLIESANNHYAEELEDAQIEATDYFHGRAFGDEEEGRSKVVSTDLRDAVDSVRPSLMRIFLGPEAPVEFVPRRLQAMEVAKQQTDVANSVFVDQNDGFTLLSTVLDDALVRKLGVLKVFFDESKEVEGRSYTGLTLEEIAYLLDDKDVELVDAAEGELRPGQPASEQNPGVPETQLYNVSIKRVRTRGRVCVDAVPNEEFRYAPARTLRESPCIVHTREMPAADVIAMGVDEDLVEREAGKVSRTEGEGLYEARQFERTDQRLDDTEGHKSMRPVVFTEALVRMDVDDDGLAEWRKFRCVGPKFKIDPSLPEGELTDGPNYALFTPRPLAHLIAGMSFHDFLKDIQRIISQIERGVLDSLALALEQKVFFKDGMVNVDDLIDPDILNFVRVYGDPNQVMRMMEHRFVGPEAIPVLEWYEHKREERIGITKASRGLDADSLQSSTKQAVTSTLDKAQERIEMIARAFAETGMKDLFRLINKLTIQHKNQPFVTRLRGKYVEVDPKVWDADLDLVVNVGVGRGSREERAGVLMKIAEDQAFHMQNGSPLVTWQHVRNVRTRLVGLLGYEDVDEFYKPWGPEQQQAYEQQQQAQAAQNQPKDQMQILAEVETNKLQLEAMVQKAKLEMQAQKMQLDALRLELEDDRARDKAAVDAVLQEYKLELENQARIDDAERRAQVEETRATALAAPTEGGAQ